MNKMSRFASTSMTDSELLVKSATASRSATASLSRKSVLTLCQTERSRFRIDMDDLDIEQGVILGGGKGGQVFRATWEESLCCVKKVHDVTHYLQEGDLFFEASLHPNICRYFGWSSHNENHYIVMEYFPDQSLLNILKGGKVFNFDQQIAICRQMSASILHLHRKKIVHADIALRNVLMDLATLRVALTDFGLSRRSWDTRTTKVICPQWSSPELCDSRVFTTSSDVYALGCTIVELFKRGNFPFGVISNTEALSRITSGEHPPIATKWPHSVQTVVKACFEPEEDRWEIKEICKFWKSSVVKLETTAYE